MYIYIYIHTMPLCTNLPFSTYHSPKFTHPKLRTIPPILSDFLLCYSINAVPKIPSSSLT